MQNAVKPAPELHMQWVVQAQFLPDLLLHSGGHVHVLAEQDVRNIARQQTHQQKNQYRGTEEHRDQQQQAPQHVLGHICSGAK